MADLTITEYVTYEEFAQAWDAPDSDMRMLWQLLGQLDEDEVLIKIPEWLAEENVGYVAGAIPTAFVGRIERETEKAILFGDSADARSLMKLAHRMEQLERGEEDVKYLGGEPRGFAVLSVSPRNGRTDAGECNSPRPSPMWGRLELTPERSVRP